MIKCFRRRTRMRLIDVQFCCFRQHDDNDLGRIGPANPWKGLGSPQKMQLEVARTEGCRSWTDSERQSQYLSRYLVPGLALPCVSLRIMIYLVPTRTIFKCKLRNHSRHSLMNISSGKWRRFMTAGGIMTQSRTSSQRS